MASPLFWLLLPAVLVGLHLFATLLERSDRKHARARRLAAIRARREGSALLFEQARQRDRAQPEAVDAMVIRHLRGGLRGSNG